MKTISISELKTHLSAELKRVKAGETLMITDRSRGIALVTPLPSKLPIVSSTKRKYNTPNLEPLISKDPLEYLDIERQDRW